VHGLAFYHELAVLARTAAEGRIDGLPPPAFAARRARA
jgi:hypothetical protein